ncbi:hypothetical protein [Streptosporangium lutulentum]|uniref:DUF3558 domain-containing protein n=1 Tax=Streptosporangium lutulentum TaxID=1461250 RepID=A0ABT9Q7F9_9ACTN|nr:hypothetical protein [Streptosporangium lutulentum]MDP9842253.1 hypothetical protein [Streptosporangium lutulentum]
MWWLAGGIGAALILGTVVIGAASTIESAPSAGPLRSVIAEDLVDDINDAGIKCMNPVEYQLDDAEVGMRAVSCSLYGPDGSWHGLISVKTSIGNDELFAREVAFYQQPDTKAMTNFPIWVAKGDRWLVSVGTAPDTAKAIATVLGRAPAKSVGRLLIM